MKKLFLKTVLGFMGLMGTLVIGVVNAQEINKDIVIEATSTAANQRITINKYFANTYKVDRGDGSPIQNVTSYREHTYSVASGYTITLSLAGGAERWTFNQNSSLSNPLVSKAGTTMIGVKIVSMPSLADGFGENATNPGNNFFYYFNRYGAITSLPENSFNTSNITVAGNNFFDDFNYGGLLTSLPANSFDTNNITTVGDSFFYGFNYKGAITSLPANSFDISNIATVGVSFFYSFNEDGALTSLPENSFRFSTGLTTVGSSFFTHFNYGGLLTNLPESSFNTENITTVGHNFFNGFNYAGKLISLPEKSFRFSTGLITVGHSFFNDFNGNGALISLPEGSFNTENITTAGSNFFSSFNDRGNLRSLPERSFDTSKITTGGDYFFHEFNNRGKLTKLPEGSFRFSTGLTTVGYYFFADFNYGGSLTELPEGSFNTSYITDENGGFFVYFNGNGALESLPEGSFDISNISIAKNQFFSAFNSNGALTGLPEGSFNTSQINTVGNDAFYYFNYGGAITSLPENSFDTSNITTAGNNFFSNFNYNGKMENLPDSFKMSSVGASVAGGYQNAFNSSSYTLNKKVSDLVSGVTAPLSDRNTFSDNQPGRCDVADNWLVNPATACKTVTFETNSGSLVDSQIVDIDVNEKVIKPIDPTKTGHTFTGWYSDENLTELFDFSTVITDDTTLYAKWQVNQYTITIDIDGTLTAITGDYGSPVNKPSNPKKDGYRFIGWEPEIPDTMPAEDMTVKAKWERNGSSGGGGGGGGGGGSSSSSSTGSNAITGSDNSNNTGNQQTGSGANYSTGTQNEQPTSGTKIKEPEANTGNNIQTGNQVDNPLEDSKSDKHDAEDPSANTSEGQTYTPEFQQAYEFAKGHGITTMPTIQKADMDGKLTRIAMAKMLSQYAINVLGKTPDTTQNNKFNDVTDKQNSDYDNGVTLAYQLGIMGQNMPGNNFRPDDEVTRAEFATALSRMIYGTSDGVYKSTDKYYTNHMEKLVEEGIITKDNPKMKELRGYVMIMLMRSAK